MERTQAAGTSRRPLGRIARLARQVVEQVAISLATTACIAVLSALYLHGGNAGDEPTLTQSAAMAETFDPAPGAAFPAAPGASFAGMATTETPPPTASAGQRDAGSSDGAAANMPVAASSAQAPLDPASAAALDAADARADTAEAAAPPLDLVTDVAAANPSSTARMPPLAAPAATSAGGRVAAAPLALGHHLVHTVAVLGDSIIGVARIPNLF